jgi:hypothetical protein
MKKIILPASSNKKRSIRISRNIFRISGVYGILILAPQLFRERSFDTAGIHLSHPEFFYGFFLVSLAFQVLFIIISTDPLRYRSTMIACFIEKGGHFISCLWLFLHNRVSAEMFLVSSPDALMLCLFIYSYRITQNNSRQYHL